MLDLGGADAFLLPTYLGQDRSWGVGSALPHTPFHGNVIPLPCKRACVRISAFSWHSHACMCSSRAGRYGGAPHTRKKIGGTPIFATILPCPPPLWKGVFFSNMGERPRPWIEAGLAARPPIKGCLTTNLRRRVGSFLLHTEFWYL